MRVYSIRLLIFCILMLTVVACGRPEIVITRTPMISQGVAGEQPTPTLAPTVLRPIPTATATEQAATPSQPATFTPVPTATPAPTATPTPIALTEIITFTQVVAGLEKPVDLTHAGDERLFVVEQAGLIKIIVNGQLSETPFLDIRDRVHDKASEQGLLSLAFHPQYAQNGKFYVAYIGAGSTLFISSFQVSDNPDIADPTTEFNLLPISQPYDNHNGCQLQFGPDNMLYISLGDGGLAGDPEENAQNQSILLGSILRVDVNNGDDYAVPADNPFVGDEDGRNEIWAYGLRNPWRFSFDSLTGDIYIADVGQGNWEEVNWVSAETLSTQNTALNFGWDIMEGNHCYSDDDCDGTPYIAPVAEYSHENNNCSITGGYIYRGTQFPALWGSYFYGDFCSGDVWSLTSVGDEPQAKIVADTDFSISSFGQGSDGELYLLSHGGEIYRIETILP